MYSLILQDFHLLDSEVANVYPFGSQVYKTHSYSSDHDFVIILNKDVKEYALSAPNHKLNVHLYSIPDFEQQLLNHKIVSLECLFLPPAEMLKNSHRFTFVLNKDTLRHSISEKTSHSWVKAKKKMEVEKDKDIYIAKKSLFHALRIADFGCQIAEFHKIVDYSSCNSLWEEIKDNPSEQWEDYKDQYQSLFNHKMTLFRKLAPKK